MSNINTRNVSAAEEALIIAKNDLIAFGKLFLPDDFMRSDTPFFHYEIADKIFEKDKYDKYVYTNLAVVMPRGPVSYTHLTLPTKA